MPLPKQHRLKLSGNKYLKLREKGKLFLTSEFQTVVYRKNKELPAKFVFIVPKKLDKRAVKRNRTRRLMSSAAEKLLAEVEKGYDIMLIARKIFKNKKLNDVFPLVKKSLINAKILNVRP